MIDDWETTLDRKLRSRFSVRLMSDTKWRELWQLIARHSLRVTLAYADNQDWDSQSLWGPFPQHCVQQRGIGDPGVGGPLLYKQILAVRIPKQNQETGAFMSDVAQLGKLPVSATEQFIEFQGYR